MSDSWFLDPILFHFYSGLVLIRNQNITKQEQKYNQNGTKMELLQNKKRNTTPEKKRKKTSFGFGFKRVKI